ncbi:MAG TPA: M42 family metallopeptidase [Clostridiales bacterium]|nr:M42 family metallopeptidase [Clostridiales bacterium]
MNLTDLLKDLSNQAGVSGLSNALNAAKSCLSEFVDEVYIKNGSVIGSINGKYDYTILLDAHIDEIGMVVTSIEKNGFVRVSKIGAVDVRTLPAQPVNIWGKERITGIFCSTPPHLSKKDKDKEVPDITEMYIDTGLPAERLKEIVSPGDRVTFMQQAKQMLEGKLTGKSFDNRASVAALIETARKLKDKPPECNVVFLLSDQEELGCRGAKTAAFDLSPNEAIAVDVSFGDFPDVPAHKSGKLGNGPMIGISPVLSKSITEKIKQIAKSQNIKHQFEVMGGETSTNADVINLAKSGIPCGLVSIPLRNMHTTVEVICEEDVKNTAELLFAYVTSCGLNKGGQTNE